MKNYESFKRTITKSDLRKEEINLFKTIMCPLKEKCLKITNRRWPTSSIRTHTQFGDMCPFAHHPMELRFPESLFTSYSSNVKRINSLEKSIVSEDPKKFKPAGRLFDCQGVCNSASGKHIGGPCNLCRYLKTNDETQKKF